VKIVIDTNILRQDFFPKSRKSEMLIDFISKTENQIVLPEVVHKEIVALYERTLSEKYGHLLKSYKDFEKITIIPIELKIPDPKIDKQVEKFISNLKNKLGIKNIVPMNNNHLPDLVNRAINRIFPFTESKSEFRDALIWLCLLDLAQSEKGKAIIFISANIKDFSDKKGKLHKRLLEEAKSKGVNVQYFQSLDSFLKTKASKIEFITKEWLVKNLNFEKLEEKLISAMEIQSIDILNKLAEENSSCEQISSIVQCTELWLNDFYVYEMTDMSIRIEATFESQLEIEYTTREIRENSWDMDYVFSPYKGKYKIEPVYKEKIVKKAGYDYFYPIVKFVVHIIVKNDKIVSTELVVWEI